MDTQDDSPCQSAVNQISENASPFFEGPHPIASNSFGLLFSHVWQRSHSSSHRAVRCTPLLSFFASEKQKSASHAVVHNMLFAHAVSLHSQLRGCRPLNEPTGGCSDRLKSRSSGFWLIVAL